ncbi:MAG: helix-turn-helix domain-containing protein [Thermoproteota archaeon]|nr:helix-turn-helix domain-containing protein [Thermoproteota archaeon]
MAYRTETVHAHDTERDRGLMEGITAEGTPSKVRKQKSMAEIRRLVGEGYPHNDIMKQLRLPRRTYFRYLSEAFDHDWQLLKQQNNDADMLALEISKLKETFREAQRILLQIINSPKTPARQKIRACDALCRTGAADLQLTYQGPLIMNRAIKDIDLARHFKGRFASEKVVDFV